MNEPYRIYETSSEKELRQRITDLETRSNGANPVPGRLREQEVGKESEPPAPITFIDDVVHCYEEPEPEPRKWVMGSWIPHGAITVLFGDGGMGKSYLALHLAELSCIGGDFCGIPLDQAPALYLDAELEKEEFMRRAYQVARGLGLDDVPQGLEYLKLPGSIAQLKTQVGVANTIRALGVGFVILDSLSIGASGDNPSEAEDIIKTMTGLQEWGTLLAVDHITKAHAASNMAYASQFGSVFKRNIARSSMRIVQADGGGICLQHDKSNFGPKQSPLYLSVDFDNVDGVARAIHYRQVAINDDNMAGIQEHLPAAERVYEAMAAEDDGKATVTWLADTLKMSQKTVSNHLTTLRKRGRVEREATGLWQVIRPPTLSV